jgi:hypothetical protein
LRLRAFVLTQRFVGLPEVNAVLLGGFRHRSRAQRQFAPIAAMQKEIS